MLQYILTGLAGLALGIVAMRVWHMREQPAAEAVTAAAEPASGKPEGKSNGLTSSRNLLVAAGGLALLSVAVLLFRGDPGASKVSGPIASGAAADAVGDVDSMISRLAARLEKEPNDGEGFRMLGWSYVMTGRPDKAIAPYKRAMELLPKQAVVHAGYGEALVGVAGGKVTPEAKASFDTAISLDPSEPRARYFQALWLAQNGQEKKGLDQLVALANSAPADAPWQADVRAKIKEISGKLGIDVSGQLKTVAAPPAAGSVPIPGTVSGAAPSPNDAQAAAISAMPPAQQQASIDGMVEGLAAKLKANPKDAKGWAMLIRSRMVQGQDKLAASDLATARKALAGDAEGLAQINAAARDAGVPGA